MTLDPSGPLEQELQTLLASMWVLGIKLGHSTSARSALNH